MIELNLIPKDYRQQVSRFQLIILTKNLFLWLVVYTIFVAIVLLVAKFILQRRFEVIIDQTTLVTRENRQIENQVRDFNRTIIQARNLQAQEIDWTSFINDLSSQVPPGVRLTEINLTNGQRSTISGSAKLRDDLLNFKNNLEKQPEISKLELPLANLQNRENINFNLSFNFSLKRKTGYAPAN
jgi:Tfp pilus assembly protein PilN